MPAPPIKVRSGHQRVSQCCIYSMKGKYKETPLTPHRSQMKTPCFLSFKDKFTLPALWTANVFFFHICKIFDDVTREACCSISNTLQIESMIKNRCGHGLEPPFVVRLVSNNRALAMSMWFYAIPRYSLTGWTPIQTLKFPDTKPPNYLQKQDDTALDIAYFLKNYFNCAVTLRG